MKPNLIKPQTITHFTRGLVQSHLWRESSTVGLELSAPGNASLKGAGGARKMPMVPSNTDLLRLAPPSSGQTPFLGLHPGLKGVGGKPGPSMFWAATSPSPTSNLRAFVTSAPRPFSGSRAHSTHQHGSQNRRALPTRPQPMPNASQCHTWWSELSAGGDSGSESYRLQGWPACLACKDRAFKTQRYTAAIKIPRISPHF